MSGGPIFPFSAYPVTAGKVFPHLYVGAGANSKHEEVLGVMASLNGDAIWRLRFLMPPTAVPSGTPKLRLLLLANDASHVVKINPKWAAIAANADPSSATLTAEGTQTVTWATGGADKYTELKVDLDGTTAPAAGQIVVMDLTFETSGWTMATILGAVAALIWE